MVKRVIKVTLILLILALLPLGSYYYLNKGLDYRLEKLSSLNEYGKLPIFGLEDSNGEKVNSDDYFADRISLIYIDDDGGNSKSIERFEEVSRPFQKDNSVLTFLYGVKNVKDAELMRESGIQRIMDNTSPQLDEFLNKVLTKESAKRPVVLIDGNLQARYIYDLENENETELIFEHVALLIPTVKKRKDEK